MPPRAPEVLCWPPEALCQAKMGCVEARTQQTGTNRYRNPFPPRTNHLIICIIIFNPHLWNSTIVKNCICIFKNPSTTKNGTVMVWKRRRRGGRGGERISSNSVLRSSRKLLWTASHFFKQLPLTLFLAQCNKKIKEWLLPSHHCSFEETRIWDTSQSLLTSSFPYFIFLPGEKYQKVTTGCELLFKNQSWTE